MIPVPKYGIVWGDSPRPSLERYLLLGAVGFPNPANETVMPALPPIANVLRVAFSGIYGDTNWANIMYVRYSGSAPTTGTLNTLASGWGTVYQTRFLTGIASLNKVLTLVTLIDLSSNSAPVGGATLSLAGNGANPSLPAQVCVGVRWTIQLRYRGGHPRTYLNGVPGSWQFSQKTITTAAQSALATAAANFRTDINATAGATGPFELGTVSYYQGTDPVTGKPMRRVAPLFIPFTGASVDIRLDTQRRRLGRDVA